MKLHNHEISNIHSISTGSNEHLPVNSENMPKDEVQLVLVYLELHTNRMQTIA